MKSVKDILLDLSISIKIAHHLSKIAIKFHPSASLIVQRIQMTLLLVMDGLKNKPNPIVAKHKLLLKLYTQKIKK